MLRRSPRLTRSITLDDLKTVQEAIGDPVQDCVPVVNTRLQI